MLDIVNLLLGILFVIFLLPEILYGETIAVKGTWHDVKLHCRVTGEVRQWSKHTKETPRVWFRCEKVWRR